MPAPPAPFGDIHARARKVLEDLFAHPPAQLFHYTTGAGLRGILESNRLRGGNFRFMNDRSEFEYGVSLLCEIAAERLTSNFDPFERGWLALLVSREQKVTRAELYLTCFCAKEDLLSQWRGYGTQDSRYCLRFDPSRFEFALSDVGGIFPVIYERDRQRQLLGRILDLHLGVERPDTAQDVAEWVRSVYSCCLVAFAFIKNPTFEEEHEWRAFLFAWPANFVDQLEFADAGGIMKPYLSLLQGPSAGRLPLTGVIAGASRAVAQSVRSAELMLAKFNYADVPVEPSRVPLSA